MKKRTTLSGEETELEARMDEFVPASKEKRSQVESILAATRKTRNINIRVSEYDLQRIKKLAIREGIPYQTLISSVLHKYVSDRLVDEEKILKSLELIARREH